jgi:hypothetical protein
MFDIRNRKDSAMSAAQAPEHQQHEIEFTVDGEPVRTTEHQLTPVQIMELAGVDPATHYLKEIRGQQQISYRDTPNDPIHVHNNQRFITNSLEPTPVS